MKVLNFLLFILVLDRERGSVHLRGACIDFLVQNGVFNYYTLRMKYIVDDHCLFDHCHI